MVHKGLLEVYKAIKPQLLAILAQENGVTDITVAGHSLGAGISVLCALDIAILHPSYQVQNYAIACPRVGNASFCTATLSQSNLQLFEIINTADVIPQTPLAVTPNISNPNYPYFYSKCAKRTVSFTSNWQSIQSNHRIENYICFLSTTT